MASESKCPLASTISFSQSCSVNLYTSIKRTLGYSFRGEHCKRDYQIASCIKKYLELKAVIATDNTTVVACMNKEGDMWSYPIYDLVWRILTYCSTYSRAAECGSGQAIQARLDQPKRVISPSRGLSVHMYQVLPTSNTPVCNECSANYLSWAVDAFSLPWQDLNTYAFSPVAILGKVVRLTDYPCRSIILIAPGWPNMPWFWDLVAMSSQILLCMPNLANLLTLPFN